jgi:hypothetical protein
MYGVYAVKEGYSTTKQNRKTLSPKLDTQHIQSEALVLPAPGVPVGKGPSLPREIIDMERVHLSSGCLAIHSLGHQTDTRHESGVTPLSCKAKHSTTRR